MSGGVSPKKLKGHMSHKNKSVRNWNVSQKCVFDSDLTLPVKLFIKIYVTESFDVHLHMNANENDGKDVKIG